MDSASQGTSDANNSSLNSADDRSPADESVGNDVKNPTKKKRGMKPRSKRNRKRPRSQVHSYENLTFQTCTRRLELNGKSIGGPCCWIRMVEPYPYTFATHAKARWIGLSVLDIYHTEFGSYPKSYYESAIMQGRILVSDKKVDPSYAIKGGDVLTHTVHRHEPAVVVSSPHEPNVRVLQETSDVIVVDKPGTLPVHPCGGYHQNSLLKLLEKRYGKLYTINRLDRLTSGLVVLAKTSAVAQQWGRCLMDRDSCQKLYLARVRGKFPMGCRPDLCLKDISSPKHGEWVQYNENTSTAVVNGSKKPDGTQSTASRQKHALGYWITDSSGKVRRNVPLSQVFDSQWEVDDWIGELDAAASRENWHSPRMTDSDANSAKPDAPLWFHLACPTRVASPKDGICEAGSFDELDTPLYEKTVKPSETAFGVVRYDARTDSTVVLCRPTTGRTHQIRLHLQYCCHPIANDPNYGGEVWYGDPEAQDACRAARAQLDAMDSINVEQLKEDQKEASDNAPVIHVRPPDGATMTDTPANEDEVRNASLQPRAQGESMQEYIRKTCVWCARSRGGGNDRMILEVLVRSRGIWLHALQYSIMSSDQRSSFRTEPPDWS